MDVEAVLARHIVKRAIYVGPLLAMILWIARGPAGAAASLLGVAIVVANFLLSGFVLSRAARVSLNAYQAAALFGFFVRLGLITVTMLLALQFVDLDRTALAVSVVAAYLALLVWEAAVFTRGGERELEWTQ